MSEPGVSYLAAFAGGLVTFAFPCVLPLVPAYLSVITGLEVSEIGHAPRRRLWRIARDTSLFIAGFATVLITLSLTATPPAQALVHRQALITRISGLLVLAASNGAAPPGAEAAAPRAAGAAEAASAPGESHWLA